MDNLPAVRMTASRAFTRTGLGYAGPFNVKKSRNKTQKAYLYICVHRSEGYALGIDIGFVSECVFESSLS